jgi:hypothetical protein
MKGWKKIYQASGPGKQAGISIFISDKVNFKPKLVRGDKEGHFILIKGAMHQEEITIVNLHALNFVAPNFIKHILLDLKTQLDPNIVVVRDINTLSPVGRSSRQKKKNQQRNSRIE